MLDEILDKCAEQCELEGVAIDGEPCGAVHQWVLRNVSHRPEQTFWIVTLLTAQMADREAQREGYKNQADRAAQKTFANYRNVQTVPGLPPKWERIHAIN